MRRNAARLLVFLGIYGALILSSHAYMATRLLFEPGWQGAMGGGLLWALTGGAALLLAGPVLGRLLPSRSGLLSMAAYVWMGTCWYLLTALWVTDLGLWLWGDNAQALAQARAMGVAGFASIMVGLGLWSGLRAPPHRRVEVRIEGWPPSMDGYRIVQISDVHIGSVLRRAFAQTVVDRVNQLDPDLVAVTGDLVDGSVEQLHHDVAPFAELQARDGVFFVTGNHDHYSGASAWVRKVEELGMVALRNRRVSIGEAGGVGFELAGVDDHSSGRMSPKGGEDVPGALEGRPDDRPVVLLAHSPNTFAKARHLGVDLQLSGHTHGGQMWPFNHLVKLQTPWVAGLYRDGRSQLYVSRGTGFWGPPMRVLAPSEVTEITLRPSTDEAT